MLYRTTQGTPEIPSLPRLILTLPPGSLLTQSYRLLGTGGTLLASDPPPVPVGTMLAIADAALGAGVLPKKQRVQLNIVINSVVIVMVPYGAEFADDTGRPAFPPPAAPPAVPRGE